MGHTSPKFSCWGMPQTPFYILRKFLNGSKGKPFTLLRDYPPHRERATIRSRATPSLSQATKLKELSSKQQINVDTLYDVMTRPKANQKETLKLDMDKLRDFFPNCLPKDMETIIFQILKDWKRNRERQRRFDREER